MFAFPRGVGRSMNNRIQLGTAAVVAAALLLHPQVRAQEPIRVTVNDVIVPVTVTGSNCPATSNPLSALT